MAVCLGNQMYIFKALHTESKIRGCASTLENELEFYLRIPSQRRFLLEGKGKDEQGQHLHLQDFITLTKKPPHTENNALWFN